MKDIKKIFNTKIDLKNYDLKKIIPYILLSLWVFNPIIEYIFNCGTYYILEMNYIVGIIGLITYGYCFFKYKKENTINFKNYIPHILILMLVIWSIISSLLSDDIYLSFFGERYRKEGLIVYILYVGFILVSSLILDNKYVKNIFRIIVFSALFITILPLFKSDFTYINFTNIFHNTNHYGYFLMISVMLSLFMYLDNKKNIKILYLFVYIFLLYILIRNDTFGCYLSILITLISLFIYSIIKKYKRKDIIIIILVFILTSFFVSLYDIKIGEKVNKKIDTRNIVLKNFVSFNKDINSAVNNNTQEFNNAGSGRGILWKEAFKYTMKHPIFGGGMESLQQHYINQGLISMDRPHNIILQISSFIGIPGAVLYISLILYLAISNLKNLKNNDLNIYIYFTAMAYFISSMFGNSMYYTSPYFMILLGMLIGFSIKKEIS